MLAQEEARLLKHDFIGTEHLLLGLLHESEGVAARALEALDISPDAVRAKVEEILGSPPRHPVGSPPFTPRAKKALEFALREALQLGHNYIGTEHILLGVVREGEGVGVQVLTALGADLTRVRHQVVQLLAGYQTEPPSAPGSARRLTAVHGVGAAECAFCGRRPPHTGRLVAGAHAAICEHCLTALGARLRAGEFDDPGTLAGAVGSGGEAAAREAGADDTGDGGGDA